MMIKDLIDVADAVVSDLSNDNRIMKRLLEHIVVIVLRMRNNEELFSNLNDPTEEPIEKFNELKEGLYRVASDLVAVPTWRPVSNESNLSRFYTLLKKAKEEEVPGE